VGPSVVVDNVSKCYRIGELRHETMLRDTLARLFSRSRSGRRPATEREFWALRSVSFDVEQGEVVGIVGRNGAGKSTLLKLISRISDPTTGSVRARGRVVSLLEVGTGFHPELTGRENIYLNGSILGMKKREVDAQLGRIVEFAGHSQFIDTPIKRYSSGMKLRLGFAIAAHLDPDVLIVDEVLAVGDVAFQKKCLAAMGDLRSAGRTVLFVSHNMDAVENLCSRVIWIDEGRIRRDGETSAVVREYLGGFALESRAEQDLRTYEQRTGSGEIRFTGIELLAPDGQRQRMVRSGDPVVVRLHFAARTAVVEPHFGLQISTEMGTLITDLSTWTTGLEIPVLGPGEGSIDFEIDSLSLMPGVYYLSLWLRSVGPIHYDVLEHFMQLEVETSNYFKSGRGVHSHFGLVFFPCRWHPPALR